jgi:GTP-binding protein HflX
MSKHDHPPRRKGSRGRERALLVQVTLPGSDRDAACDSLAELERLGHTAGIDVIGSITQRRSRFNPSLCIGEGKLSDIQLACRQGDANVVIFNNELSPVQVNNLDLSLGISVIDRTELILQIFARRARSAEAQVQVELAQLEYLVSRIPVSAKQQRFQGGIGMRGPGESPFRMRNAPMRRRITYLKKKIDRIQGQRRRTRQQRRWPLVALVGYTNAGKSTLLNAFSKADAYVDDRLFATLDTKTRLVRIAADRDVLVTDTVGFIRDLPHGLIASFRSTLEEVAEADLLLHVADAGHPYTEDHCRIVDATLKEIGAGEVPSLFLLNKCDRAAGREAMSALCDHYPHALRASALTGDGLDCVAARIDAVLSAQGRTRRDNAPAWRCRKHIFE